MEKKIEAIKGIISGYWNDIIYDVDGNVLEVTPTKKNMITINAAKAMAAFVGGLHSGGIMYSAFGSGQSSWDITPVAPTLYETKLVNEIYRGVPAPPKFIKYGFGKAQSGSSTEIFDPRRIESSTLVGRIEEDDFYNGMTINIVSGTNIGESRTILDYERSSGKIEVSSPFSSPVDSTTEYEIPEEVVDFETNHIIVRSDIPAGTVSDSFNGVDYREFGFFAGNATAVKDSGLMLNKINFPVRSKLESFRFSRLTRFSFLV